LFSQKFTRCTSRSSLICLALLFNTSVTTRIYTLSLHDALPISMLEGIAQLTKSGIDDLLLFFYSRDWREGETLWTPCPEKIPERSEEHTSELQSRFDLVCRLLLEKKKRELHIDIFIVRG